MIICINHFSSFFDRKHNTFYIFILSVTSVLNLSFPNPHPAVYCNPYSTLLTKLTSMSYVLSSAKQYPLLTK